MVPDLLRKNGLKVRDACVEPLVYSADCLMLEFQVLVYLQCNMSVYSAEFLEC